LKIYVSDSSDDGEALMQAISNIRIVDMTRALAGPFCTMMLGDLGADVIKVERPGKGDESRGWGPPFVGENYSNYSGESAYFLASNRNKRSLTINLKSSEGQEIIRRLAATSDVFVENYRTGVLDKMGLGYDQLHAVNPQLVYCSISGYGRTGPYADRPGYDAIMQAEGGMMSITGPIDGPAYRVGIPIIDITAGMFASTAILAALRARDQNGEGQLVDVSLMDTQVALLANVAANYLIGENEPARLGNGHPNIAPYGAFPAKDRWLVVGAANARQWEILCNVLECPELKTDPRFVDNTHRLAHRFELDAELGSAFSVRDADEWLAVLREAGLPCGPINSVPDVFRHPQAEARAFTLTIDHPSAGEIRVPGFPYKLSNTPAAVRRYPPRLGEHSAEILDELLQYSPQQITALREQGVI